MSVLSGTASATATFTAPDVSMDETLTFRFTVTDNDGAQASDEVMIAVRRMNNPPIVNAGADQSVDAGVIVALSGTARDPDGSIASYLWEQTGGTMSVLSGTTSATAMFTAPDVSVDETLTFRLTVTDNDGAEATDEVMIVVRRVNKPPIVNAGADQSVDAGVIVALSGTARDPDGSIASYLWEQTGGTMSVLSGTTSATAMFTAPDVSVDETLTFRLTVTDNDGAEATDEVMIVVRRVNKPPIVNAGADQSVDAGVIVALSGTARDLDGSIASYLWEQTEGTMSVLSGTTSATAMFTAPDVSVDETLTFRLTVTDNDGAEATDEVMIVVRRVNKPPIVNAGADQSVDAGVIVALSGTARDLDGSIASYLWEQTEGTMSVLSGTTSATAMFTAPDVSVDETLTFRFTVTDNDGAQVSGDVSVTVRPVNLPPVVSAEVMEIEQFVEPIAGGDDLIFLHVYLIGTASDPDGAIVKYQWDEIGGPTVTLSGADTPIVSFIIPASLGDAVETWIFRLTVTDVDGAQASDEVFVDSLPLNRPPVVSAYVDHSFAEGDELIFLIGEAIDPEGRIVSHLWEQTSGRMVTLASPDELVTGFIVPDVSADEMLTFRLTVTYDDGAQASDEVSVTVRPVNLPPVVIVEEAFPSIAEAGVIVFLIGTAADPDGSIASYLWEQTGGTMVSLASADDLVAAFTAPDVSADDTLTFRLTVTDDDGATGHDTVSVTITVSPGTGAISGTLNIGAGSVLDGDTKDVFAPVVENNSIQGQSIRLAPPITIAGHADYLDDEVDIYRVTLPEAANIVLTTGDWPAADLDLYLADTDGTIIDASLGTERFDYVWGVSPFEEEFLVMVHASSGSSNYSLSFRLSSRAYDGSTFSQASGAGLRLDDEFVPNEVIAEFREGLAGIQADALSASIADVAGDVEVAELAASPSGPILLGFQDADGVQLDSLPSDGGIGPLHYDTPEMAQKARLLQTIKNLGANPAVSYAEPNYISHALLIPDDPRYVDQWHYPLINLPAAWDITTGSDDVVIAVIDSGIRPHVDLWDRVLRETRFIGPGPGDVVGYDFIRPIDPDPIDPAGLRSSFHGTHVAGTIGAETNNGQGVAGVTWQGKIMPLRVLNSSGSGKHYDIIQAIYYAAGLANSSGSIPSRRADIINMSLGMSNVPCKPLRSVSKSRKRAIERALDAGVHVVVAAGNDDCDVPTPMSTVDGVITVSAVNSDGVKAYFSNYGRTIDVAAPGVAVLSTMSDDSAFPSVYDVYEPSSGTSMATPHVAGVLALMLSVNPDLTPVDFNRLLAGTDPHPQAGPITHDLGALGRDDIYGHGLIDAHKAVQAALAILPPPPSDNPILSAYSESLSFGEYRTELFYHVFNIGTGELVIDSVTTDKRWLVAEFDPLYWYVRVRVDRTGLPEGVHSGHVSITSNGGDRTVPVTVQSNSSGGNAGTVYILVVDPDTLEPVAQAMTDAAQHYVYWIPEVPAGTYIVVAGTDRDDDGFICDPGEACGAWPAIDSQASVEVIGGQTGIDIPVSLDLITGPDEPPLAEFLPAGIRRLRR